MKVFEYKVDENGNGKRGKKIAEVNGVRGHGFRVYRYGKIPAVSCLTTFDYLNKIEDNLTADYFGVDYITCCTGKVEGMDGDEWLWIVVPNQIVIDKHIEANKKEFGHEYYPSEEHFKNGKWNNKGYAE
jgi:hypothetical protein